MNNDSDPGFGGRLAGVYTWGSSSISVNTEGGGTLAIFGTNDDVAAFSIHYGWIVFQQSVLFRFAAGPAFLTRSRTNSSLFGSSTDYADHQFGGSAEVETMFRTSYFGFGLVLSAAASPKISMVELTANITLGKLE